MPEVPVLVGRATDTTTRKGKEVRHLFVVLNLPTISRDCVRTAPRDINLKQETVMNSPILATPSISIVNNHAVTASKAVADYFHKRHDHILQSIKNLLAECGDWGAPNFREVFRDVDGGQGAVRKMPMYEITRDGFVLLAMGFTGKKALAWKIAYITAFNGMEAELAKSNSSQATIKQTLTPAMQQHIQERVNELVSLKVGHYQTIYRSIKKAFRVGTYKDIAASQYPALCTHLGINPLEGEYLPQSGQQIAATELPPINVKSLMLDGLATLRHPLTPELKTALDQKAIAMAMEAHELCREHLVRNIAYNCENKFELTEAKAMKLIESSTLDRALTQKFYVSLKRIEDTSWAAMKLAAEYHQEIQSVMTKH
jgi:Rha family phage regulatory protein